MKKKLKYGAIAVVLVIIGINLGSSRGTKEAASKNETSQSRQLTKDAKHELITVYQSNIKQEKDEPKVPAEHSAALRQAKLYAKSMSMSKQGVREQLTSQYGGNFKPEAVEYAMSNLDDIDWNANALTSAKMYQQQLSMSEESIRQQLTSSYGGFTNEQAEYAIKHLAS